MGKRKSLSPCAAQGCPELVRETYCPKHKPVPFAGRRGFEGYGKEYQALKRQVLREEPWCYKCGERESVTADHVVPRGDGGSTTRGNLRGICGPCHKAKSQGEAARMRGYAVQRH